MYVCVCQEVVDSVSLCECIHIQKSEGYLLYTVYVRAGSVCSVSV